MCQKDDQTKFTNMMFILSMISLNYL